MDNKLFQTTDFGKVVGLVYDSSSEIIPDDADMNWKLPPNFLTSYLQDCQFFFVRTQHDLLSVQLEGYATAFASSWSVEGGTAGDVHDLEGQEAAEFMRNYMAKRQFELRDILQPRKGRYICRQYLVTTNWKGFAVQRLIPAQEENR